MHAPQGLGLGRSNGDLVVTFDGTSAHQVGEGEMQGPFRREVGLSQGPHTLAHLQKQLSALSAHNPSPGQLWAAEGRAKKGKEGYIYGQLCPSSPTDSMTTTQALRSRNTPLLNPGQRNSRTLSPRRTSTQKPRPRCPASCVPFSPVLGIRPGHGCLLSHLCSLEHRQPLEAFMGGVRGAAAPVARPGSSLSCILNREGGDCGTTVLRPWTISHLTAHRATGPSLPSSHFLQEARCSQSSPVAPFPELLPFLRERLSSRLYCLR